MKETWPQKKYHVMYEDGRDRCEVLGCSNPGEEAHHAILPARKAQKWRNAEINMQIVCIDCHKHSGRALTAENREAFMEGKDLSEWLDTCPEKFRAAGSGWDEIRRIISYENG